MTTHRKGTVEDPERRKAEAVLDAIERIDPPATMTEILAEARRKMTQKIAADLERQIMAGRM